MCPTRASRVTYRAVESQDNAAGGDLKSGVYFSSGVAATPAVQDGFVDPLTGEQARIDVPASKPARASSGQVGRVMEIQRRIDNLERSAMAMYSQVSFHE